MELGKCRFCDSTITTAGTIRPAKDLEEGHNSTGPDDIKRAEGFKWRNDTGNKENQRLFGKIVPTVDK